MPTKITRRAATTLLAATLARPALAAPRTKVNFAMGAGAFYFTLHYVAQAGGYYDAEGLDLDEVNVSSGPRQTAAVMGGGSDVAPLGLQLVVQASQRAGSIVAICAGYNILPMSVLLSNDAIAKSGITETMSTDDKVRRLKGMRLGITTPGSGTDDMLRALLNRRGMDPNRDITIQPLVTAEGMLAALARGATDGFCFTTPIPEIAVARHLGQIVLEPLAGDVPEAANVPYIIMATSPETIAAKRPLLLAMVRCWIKAMDLVKADPKSASQLVRRYFPDLDQPVYDTAFEKYRAGVPTSPMITDTQVQNVAAFMRISKGAPIEAKLSDVFDPSIATEVMKSLGRT